MTRSIVQSLLILVLMLSAAVGAKALRPTQHLADVLPPIDLERMIPHQFADWKEEQRQDIYVVNPQQKELLDKLYNQTLARNYINAAGYRIMLSIAYGGDQTDSMQVHKPEVCYPAQGFQLQSKASGTLSSAFGELPVTRLNTKLGQRYEPVTYWIIVGDQTVAGGLDKKITEVGYNLRGHIPDGLLVRASSIDADTSRALEAQSRFLTDLIGALDPAGRRRLAGLAPNPG
jgi:EpsI family protein